MVGVLIPAALRVAAAVPRLRVADVGFNVERKLDRISLVQMRAGASLLDLIAGFLTPSAGTLTLDGRDLLPLPPEQLSLLC